MWLKRFVVVLWGLWLGCTVQAQDPNLVGSWLFQDAIENPATTTVQDSSTNGNHGSLVGGAYLLPDDPYGGLSLDGSTGYVEVPASDSLNSVDGDVSIAAWVNIDSLANWMGILTRGDQAQTMGLQIQTIGGEAILTFSTLRELTDPETGIIDANYANMDLSEVFDYGHVNCAGLAIPAGEWAHVGMSSDTRQLIFFVNGDTFYTGRKYFFPDNEEPLYIGVDRVVAFDTRYSGRHFSGMMDDVMLYNRALSVLEMQELYGNMPAPYGPVPADGGVNVGSGVLSWQSIADAQSEELFVGSSADNLTKVADISVGTNTYTIEIEPNQVYTWQINTTTSDGVVEGDVWTFASGTVTPSTPMPGDAGKTIPVDTLLTWEPGAGSVGSDVYIGDSTKLTVAQATKDSPEYQEMVRGQSFDPELEPDTWYYWRIDAVQADGSVIAGPVWSFRTMPDDVGFLDPNMVAWYRFETGFGNVITDWTGNGNEALFNSGAPQWTDGGYDGRGLGLEFRGTGDSDTVYFHNSMVNDMTLMGWLKMNPDSPTRGNNTQKPFQGRPFLWNDSPGKWRNDFMTGITGTKYAWMIGNEDFTIHSKTDMNTGRWTHFAVTRERATGEIKLYINGHEEASAIHENTNPLNANSLLILGDHGTKLDRGWTGEIDEFKFFNSVRTAEQILKDMVPDPRLAWDPQPYDAQLVSQEVTVQLSWRAGDNATAHDVYFGTHPDDLKLVSEAQTGLTYDPMIAMAPGETYYWRIDERQGNAVIDGRVWSFTIANFLGVEDFETYTATYEDPETDENQVFLTWSDGLGASFAGAEVVTGSVVGFEVLNYGDAIMENTAAYDATLQSVPLLFNNTGNFGYGFTPTVTYSEISREIPPTEKDWLRFGSAALFIAWRGDTYSQNELTAMTKIVPATSDKLYVTVTDGSGASATEVWSGPVTDLMQPVWHEWNIPLSAFNGVELADVAKITLGIGTPSSPGGLGKILVDEIRLYAPRCVAALTELKGDLNGDCVVDEDDLAILTANFQEGGLVTPVSPSTSGLVAHLKLDGNLDDAIGKTHASSTSGSPVYVTGAQGQALQLDGLYDSVDLGSQFGSEVMAPLKDFSVSVWYKGAYVIHNQPRLLDCGHTDQSVTLLPYNPADNGGVRLRIRDVDQPDGKGDNLMLNAPAGMMTDGEWMHLGVCLDDSADDLFIYVNGQLVAVHNDFTRTPSDVDKYTFNMIGVSVDGNNYLFGTVDDLRLYSRPLSQAEMVGLAGVSESVSTLPYGIAADCDLNGDGSVNVEDKTILEANMGETQLWP